MAIGDRVAGNLPGSSSTFVQMPRIQGDTADDEAGSAACRLNGFQQNRDNSNSVVRVHCSHSVLQPIFSTLVRYDRI